MVKTLVRLAIFGLVVASLYYLLTHHIVFFGRTPKVLKKSSKTMEYTFVNGNIDAYRTAEDLLRIEPLRNDGIGPLLVEMGKISQDDLDKLEQKIDSGAPPPKSDMFGK